MPDPSPKFSVNFEDIKSLFFTALIFGVAAVLTFLGENIADLKLNDWIPGAEGFVVMLLGMIGKVLQKYYNGRPDNSF